MDLTTDASGAPTPGPITAPPRPVRGLLFDKDGTLFSFQATWGAWARALVVQLTEGDDERAAALAADLRFDLDSSLFLPDSPIIAGTEGDAVALILPHVPGMTATALTQVIAESAASLTPAEAVPLVPLLTEMRAAGLTLGVATNDGEGAARAQLERTQTLPLFDFVAGYDSGHGAKPGPGQCLAFADAAGVPADSVAMVGDSTHDLHAGRAAGMICVAVLTGVATEDDLAPHADVVLPDIGHLPAWLALA